MLKKSENESGIRIVNGCDHDNRNSMSKECIKIQVSPVTEFKPGCHCSAASAAGRQSGQCLYILGSRECCSASVDIKKKHFCRVDHVGVRLHK